MSHEVLAQVGPGAMRVQTTLGEWMSIPRKIASYLREKLQIKSIVRFLATQCANGLVATRVIHIIGPVAEYGEGGIVIVTIPDSARFRRPIVALHGYTYARSDDSVANVVIQGEAMTLIAEMVGFRLGPWSFQLYLKPGRSGKYVVTDPDQIRSFLGRPAFFLE